MIRRTHHIHCSGTHFTRVGFSRTAKVVILVLHGFFVAYFSSAYGAENILSGLADQRNIVFNRLGTEDGLSQTSITAITQDGNGFMWIGTSEGLNRFDGYNFETFFHLDDQAKSISDATIWDILSDSDGQLWVATEFGLNRFNESDLSFTRYFPGDALHPGDLGNKIFTLFEDSKKQFWIGTGVGLILMDKEGGFTSYDYQLDEGSNIQPGGVRSIFEDSKGNIWVGTEKDGVFLINENNRKLEPVDNVELRKRYVRDILEDNSGKIWISTFNQGIQILGIPFCSMIKNWST